MPKIRISRRLNKELEKLAEKLDFNAVGDVIEQIFSEWSKDSESSESIKPNTALALTETPTTSIEKFTPQEKDKFQEDVYNSLRFAVESRAIQYIVEQARTTAGTANPLARAKDILKDLSLIFGQEFSQDRLEMALRNTGIFDLYNTQDFDYDDMRKLL